MTTPSKTWVRRRVPSMTWKCTRTRSPAWNWGTRRSCARSRDSMTLLMGSAQRNARAGVPRRAIHGSEPFLPLAALHAACLPPGPDLGGMAAEQHVRDLPSTVFRGARVVRILGVAAERLRERFLRRGLRVAQGSRQLAQHGVGDDHRRQLAARDDVAADRQRVRAEVLDDPLVEALVAAAQQRDR